MFKIIAKYFLAILVVLFIALSGFLIPVEWIMDGLEPMTDLP